MNRDAGFVSVVGGIAKLVSGPGDELAQLKRVAPEAPVDLHVDELEREIDDAPGAFFVAAEGQPQIRTHSTDGAAGIAQLEITLQEGDRNLLAEAEKPALYGLPRNRDLASTGLRASGVR